MVRRVWLQSLVAVVATVVGAASCSSATGTVGPDSGTPDGPGGGMNTHDSSTSKDAPTVVKDAAHDTGPSCGSGGPLCANGATCKVDGDCKSTVCLSAMCVPESCALPVVNGTETDVGCGGSECPACATGKKCSVLGDCVSNVCTAGVCQAPTDTDGVQNDSETAVDCGGALLADGTPNTASDGAPACKVGATCLLPSDCLQGVCASAPVLKDNLDAGTDAALVDAALADAALLDAALVDAGLLDGGTSKLVCQPPTFHDGVKNDSETDVDCGGALLADGSPNAASDGAPPCAAMAACVLASDCQSDVCTAGVCQSPTATDGVQNDSETDIDCGGGLLASGAANPASDGAAVCADGKKCILGTDCLDLVCAPASVGTMGSADGGPIDCSSGQNCTCQAPTFTDGVKNDSETDIDCGGGFLVDGTVNPASDGAPVCQFQTNQNCLLGTDCNTGVCNANAGMGSGPDNCPAMTTCACQPPWDNDGVQNGGETDIDCGGATSLGSDDAPPCAPSKKCVVGPDCTSKICGTNKLCTTPTPTDGVQNGGETDVDCGGAATPGSDAAPPCADSKLCAVTTDCLSAYCSTLTKRCVDGQSCVGLVPPAPIQDVSVVASSTAGGADAVGIPDPNGVNQNAGIDTCGEGESTDLPSTQVHESCCKSLVVPGLAACSPTVACPAGETCSSTTGAGTCQVRMDKYEVTTGRVRQFIEWVKANDPNHAYNVQAWATAQFNANGTAATPLGTTLLQMIPTTGAANMLPLFPTGDIGVATYLSIVAQLGGTTLDEGYPSAAQGCYMGPGAYGAGTYWFDSTQLNDVVHSPPRPFTRDYYDIKPQNCTVYWIAAAFCAWDGGRLPTEAETKVVYGTGAYPWGAGSATVPPVLWNGQAPGVLATQANTAGFAITNYTSDWHNSDLGSATGLGDFYYYPSWVSNNPPWAANVSTLVDGSDLTPYIGAPGRFTADLTAVRTADGEGWLDYGANMMEYLQTYSQTTNAGEYCDTTDPVVTYTAAQVAAGSACPANTCGRSNLSTGDTDCGTVRATQMPPIPWEGGSWEGHGIQLYGYNEPAHTQYGKAGFRCVRPIEP